MPPPLKRQRLSDEEDEDFSASEAADYSSADRAEEIDASMDEDDDISGLKPQKSKQTKKRKLRASAPSAFGATLQSLLDTEAPSNVPLSLKPSIARKHNDEKLESKAKKVLLLEKKDREDQRRITDVIGGWGAENERSLRKVAQRGVVKLFNVIQTAQNEAGTSSRIQKGASQGVTPAITSSTKSKGKVKSKDKDNLLGRGKESLNKNDFFDLLRSGGVVSSI